MARKAAHSDRVHRPFGNYSSAILAGDTMYLAGFGPFDADQQLIGDNIVEQTRQTMINIQFMLEDNGFHMDDVVRCTVYLSTIEHWAQFNEEYGRYFNAPYPARTVIACELNGFLVEVECTAVREGRSGQ